MFLGIQEGSVLFNDTLNTFSYGYMAAADNERGNPLLPHGLLFRLAARVLLYTSSHSQDSTYQSWRNEK